MSAAHKHPSLLSLSQHGVKRQLASVVRQMPMMLRVGQSIWRRTRVHFSVGAVGVVFNDVGEVLLVEHVFHPYTPWGLPGGWVERGESPQDAVKRELREELELEVEVGAVVSAELGYGQHLDLAFLCVPSGFVGKLCGELVDYRWTALDDLPVMHPFHRNAVIRGSQLKAQRV